MSSPLHAATQSAYALHHSEMARLRQKAADLFTLLQEGKYSELQTQMAIESAKPRIKYNDESRLEYYMRCWSSYQYITPQIFKKN